MALSDIFTAIEDAYDGEIKFLDGVENLAGNSAPPRIVWGQATETFDYQIAPHWQGPPRQLMTRVVQQDVHLWGADRTAVELMLQAFVWAMRQVLGASFRLTSGRWPQGPEKIVQLGTTYVLPVTFLVPVTVPEGAEGEATITDTDTTDTSLPFGVPPPFGT